MRNIVIASAVAGLMLAVGTAYAQLGGGGKYGLQEVLSPGGGAVTGTPTCTGSDDGVLGEYGFAGASLSTDTAPKGVIVRPQAAYSGGTQTAAKLVLPGGIDEVKTTIATAANCGTDTFTVTVVDRSGTATATVLTEATNWTKTDGNNNATATSLATAVGALAGVSAAASSAVVLITPDCSTASVFVATSDATCMTIANGTPGTVLLPATAVCPTNQAGAVQGCITYHSAGIHITGSDGTTGKTLSAVAGQFTDNNNATVWITGDGGGFVVSNDGEFWISSGNSGATGAEVGIGRKTTNTLKVTDTSAGTQMLAYRYEVNSAAAPAEPVACGATTLGYVQLVQDTNDGAADYLCICLGVDDVINYDWRRVDAHETVCASY